MINYHKLEISLSRTYFHGSKGVQAIEVLLYLWQEKIMRSPNLHRRGGGGGGSVVDKTLDFQSRDHNVNPLLLKSF